MWKPRKYQLELFQALDNGIKRAFLVWHRRSGKDSACINYMAKAAYQRVGTYFYMLPTNKQARKVVWMNVTNGKRLIEQAFPGALNPQAPGSIVKRVLDDEMLIEFKNGSIFQCVGSDNHDSIVGTNPIGMVFSEWALSDPRAYDYLRPILTENGGWSIFNTTPRGKNHAHKLYKLVENNDKWFVSTRSITDTGVVSTEQVEEEIRSGMPRSRAEQEYYCSWDAANVGYVYQEYVEALERSGKLSLVAYDPRYPVETAWDIGHKDATAIWFVQRVGSEIRVIDYHEERGKTLPHFASLVHGRGYGYSRHILPHDVDRIEWGAGVKTIELCRQHGLNVVIAPKTSIEDGIEATRALLPRMVFDRVKCVSGLNALRSYHYKEIEDPLDETKFTVSPKPVHDWSSHGCDALRYLCVTPEAIGIIPAWAKQHMQPAFGHNGGPAWTPQDYDPLGQWREAGRASVGSAQRHLGSYPSLGQPYNPLTPF
jgi:phage terminase large subunit